MNTPTDTRAAVDHASAQADAQMRSIHDLTAALECDFDRLEELREEAAERAERLEELREEAAERAERLEELRDIGDDDDAEELAELEVPHDDSEELALYRDKLDDAEELAELEAQAGDCADREEAEQRIQEDALSVETRAGWVSYGDTDAEPEEFRILLCTGGPHVEMRGELSQGEPSRAWLEYQDWGTSLAERCNQPGDNAALLAYAACFFYG